MEVIDPNYGRALLREFLCRQRFLTIFRRSPQVALLFQGNLLVAGNREGAENPQEVQHQSQEQVVQTLVGVLLFLESPLEVHHQGNLAVDLLLQTPVLVHSTQLVVLALLVC